MFATSGASTTGSTRFRLRSAALAIGIGTCLVLTGCGASDDDDAASQTSESSSADEQPDTSAGEQDEESPADEAETADQGEGGGSSAEITIDGEAVDIADPTVVCQEVDGTLTIAVGSTTGTDGIGAVLEGGDSPTVTSVALGSVDGTAMGWAEGAPGDVSATKDGSTYTIGGSMMAVDASDPTGAEETPFEMQITCP